MVQRLARRLNVSMENVYCVGDHANDLGMLALSAIPFAPENAIESVRQVPGIHILPDARHGAIAALTASWISGIEGELDIFGNACSYNVHLTLRREQSMIAFGEI